ncbi:MAG: 3-deoxy-manno-octulosonate cytidylyltransferase [Hyphomicrobiales bacterium]
MIADAANILPSDKILAIIPARMASSRLPGKPLVAIGGEAMIVHVWRRAVQAVIGRVIVAAAEAEIAGKVRAAGGEAVLTPPDLESGSDRVHAALETIDKWRHCRLVINIQDDLLTIDPDTIRSCVAILNDHAIDMAIAAAPIVDQGDIDDPNVVKIAGEFYGSSVILHARDFRRKPDPRDGKDVGRYFHHIGLYAWRRETLERFVALPVSARESRYRLEQLRAPDSGMRIAAGLVDKIPLGVDTPDDLKRARQLLAGRNGVFSPA